MNRFGVWWSAAALGALLAAAGPGRAADSPLATTADDRPWYKKLFVSPPAQPGPAARTAPVVSIPGASGIGSALPAEVVADAFKGEVAALQRRMSVCLKLREAAVALNDRELERQVDELERQINALYAQRTGALGVPKTKAPLPTQAAAGLAPQLEIAPAEKPLAPSAAAARLTAPAQPVPAGSAAVREVGP
jgi:hypothetical protein